LVIDFKYPIVLSAFFLLLSSTEWYPLYPPVFFCILKNYHKIITTGR